MQTAKKPELDLERYATLSRQAATEGIVLIRNEKNTLPLKKGQVISLFGRIQLNYYKSGTGSGGMVNTEYVISILDALKESEQIRLNEKLLQIYEKWVIDNPYYKGKGWAGEPWSQQEMPITDEIVSEAARESDIAVVIIGRSAGESKDASNEKGSYLLTDDEETLLETACRHFEHVVVLLNTGNIIDMKWVQKYEPTAVLYCWQGGQVGGSAVHDVLINTVNPCGRLADTIAYEINDYPSTAYFGDAHVNYYKEDIYVGYRYFETAAKDKVMYPFGYGLSYTSFSINSLISSHNLCIAETATDKKSLGYGKPSDVGSVCIDVEIKNTGKYAGKEVVQAYFSAPQGKLGKPSRCLIGFEKTEQMKPGKKTVITLEIPIAGMASYDDSGVTGHKSSYVLEPGEYTIYVGKNVRDATVAGSFKIPELVVINRLSEALTPVLPFERMRPERTGNDCRMTFEPVPQRTYSLSERIAKNRPLSGICTGDKGYKLSDAYDGKVTMADFLSQLTDAELCCLVRAEGMCSPKVTPGTASAFGGITEALAAYGIPIGCCADGPAGIRMDSGAIAFSFPSGTALACTFNTQLITDLFDIVGRELRMNRIDLLLGPGMNIHRNPLCGRNFEYFSEDPYLTGKMAAAELKGLHNWGVSGTVKHFIANNQEFERHRTDSVISERAIREIYLRGFEIAICESGAPTIMSTYGSVNGLWTASSYDLLTTILRGEWGFDGLVMTDWWADLNDEGGKPSNTNLAAMIRAQNDIYMVVKDSLNHQDNLEDGLKSGSITRGELIRSATNICNVLTRLTVMERHLGRIENDFDESVYHDEDKASIIDTVRIGKKLRGTFDILNATTFAGDYCAYKFIVKDAGYYTLTLNYRVDDNKYAQIPLSLLVGGRPFTMLSFNGTENEWLSSQSEIHFPEPLDSVLKFFFAHNGLEIKEMTIEFNRE